MHRLIGLVLILCGCADPPCLASDWISGERSAQITLSGGTRAQLLLPGGWGRYPDGAPAIVFVRGGWAVASLPAGGLQIRFGSGRGVAQVYLDLPDDVRGADSRAAVAAALRYAAGEQADEEGCVIEDRMGSPLSGQRALVGYSNGGNLAWSVLADAEQDLPPVDGVVTFETPASAQLILFDLQSSYEPGDCALTELNAISCAVSYEGITYSAEEDVLFLDRDGDGVLGGDADRRISALESPVDGLRYTSPEAAAAMEEVGLVLEPYASAAGVAAFWSEREAPQAMAGAIERFAELATIVSATEVDHAQASLEGSPHVIGMMAAAVAAGVRWHRLNPDAAYAVLETGDPGSIAEYDANTAFMLDSEPALMPESAGAGRGLSTAAAVEILDRAHEKNWSSNLEMVLFR
ncbi:MAG: hypothetical protein ACI8S6_004246 [Myxococcota bacterium]|jgi:hypothetical protein